MIRSRRAQPEGIVFGDPEVQGQFTDDDPDVEDDLEGPWNDPELERQAHRDMDAPFAVNRRRQLIQRVQRVSVKRSGDRQDRIEEAESHGYVVDRMERESILEAFDRRCVYCGASNGRLVLDHVHPIALGGRHARDNLAPACCACNRRKWAKPLEDWMAEHGERFAAEVAARLNAGWLRAGRGEGSKR